jgi:hypothetical protein
MRQPLIHFAMVSLTAAALLTSPASTQSTTRVSVNSGLPWQRREQAADHFRRRALRRC